ncbi:MAG: metallophosphoesterase, partial [Bacteroidota bacterium]
MALKFRSFIVLIASLLLYISAASAQSTTSPVSYSVFLIGDCGEPFVSDSPIGKVLREKVQSAGPNATVLYLGDNIYPRGLPEEGEPYRETAEKVLQIQVDWIKGLEARGIFVPGNHDWDKGGKAGLERMLNQQQWLDSLHDKNFTLLPKEGCPGPIEVPLNNQAVLVILDTQWFLHPWDKPDAEGPCEAKSSAEVFNLLIDVFNRNPGKRVIVAGHHPLMSYGYHGGVFTFKDHIFPLTEVNSKLYVPLPVLGSIVVLYRKWFGNIQDVSHPNYRAFSSMIRKIMAENPGSIFVAGHEHNLQYIVKDSVNMIVSGSGSKYTPIKKTGKARFAQDVTGFVQLSVHEDNSATIHFYQVDGFAPRGKEIFTQHLGPTGALAQSVKEEPAPDWSGKTVRVKASEQYHAGRGKKIWLGANYRAEWAQEIEVPVFDIGTERGGLKIVQRGGGQQTLSLRYQDSTGHEFVTRSVEKYPEAAVPEMLRNTFAQDLVQDQISASHPYAALVVPAIAEAAGIYHTNPKLVYIPDDKRFGEYRKLFANSLALFEERPADNWNESSFFGNSKKIINTSKVLERLANDNDNAVDQEFVLKSRLFDLVI